MLGKKQLMPKWARYPIFLAGLLVIIVGGIAAASRGAPPSAVAAVVVPGFALLMISVLVR